MAKKTKTDIRYKKKSNQERDYEKFYVKDPDKDFSPERNKHIVEKTIKKAEEMRRKRKKEYAEQVGERVEAATSYALYLDSGGAKPAEKYFGKQMLAYLRGQKILERYELLKKEEENKELARFLDSLD
jgi:hypothetical protein